MAEIQGLPAGTVLGGRYRVEGALGRGGMGAVYLVRHVRTEERLALKLIHASIAGNPELVERFRREARAPAQIDSDHVVRVVDADVAQELGGAPFLVMEFLRGKDLEHVVKERGRLPPHEVIGYLGQAARALDKAHRLGIVHRDLKPENLFLAERDDGSLCLKILDFGIAKLTGEVGVETATGSMLGTPLYMAPEQAQGDTRRIGPPTDVWALGLIAFKLLTGQRYWRAESAPELILKIVASPMVPPSASAPWLGQGFDAWFARCCARAPEERFASAGEAVMALGAALGAAVPASAPIPLPPPATLPPSAAAAPFAATPALSYGGPPTVAPASRQNLVLLLAAAGVLGLFVIGGIVGAVIFLGGDGDAHDPRPAPNAPRPAETAAPTPAPSAAPAAPPGDACKAACAKLTECTQVSDPSCETNCNASPAFAACLKGRGGGGCQAFSSCALAVYCGGRGPSGGKSCKATADCEARCVTKGGDNTACVCQCVRAMAPEHASDLMTNNLCGSVHCSACRLPVDGPACMACFARECAADTRPCQQH